MNSRLFKTLVARRARLNQYYARRQREIKTSYQDRVERESALLQRISTLERERDESRIGSWKIFTIILFG